MTIYRYIHHIETDEDAIAMGKVVDSFLVPTIDDFLINFVIFLYYYPLHGGLKKAFDNADNIDQQVGICIRHAIKEAKNCKEIPQFFIDYFVKVKNARDWRANYYREELDNIYDKLMALKNEAGAMRKMNDLGNKNAKYSESIKNYTQFLNLVTFKFLNALIDLRRIR